MTKLNQAKNSLVCLLMVFCFFAAHVTVASKAGAEGYVGQYSVIWDALNTRFQESYANEKLTTLSFQDQELELRLDVNTPTVHLITSWFKQTAITPNETWTANDAMLRFLDAFSWMAQLSHDVLQSYTPYTPVDVTKYTDLFGSDGNATVYGLLPAYISDTTKEGIIWEIMPLTFLDANSQMYESAMYLYIRIVNEETGNSIEWMLADQQQVYELLKLITEHSVTLSGTDTDMSNISVWLSAYERAVAAESTSTKTIELVELPLRSIEAYATHDAMKNGTSFEVENLLDKDDTTSWQYDMTELDGFQPYIELVLQRPSTVAGIVIKNGYWKISGQYDQYSRNGRIREFEVHFRYEGQSEFTDSMQFALEDVKQEQIFDFELKENVEAIRLTILSIYEGTKFKEDVAVNELLLLGL